MILEKSFDTYSQIFNVARPEHASAPLSRFALEIDICGVVGQFEGYPDRLLSLLIGWNRLILRQCYERPRESQFIAEVQRNLTAEAAFIASTIAASIHCFNLFGQLEFRYQWIIHRHLDCSYIVPRSDLTSGARATTTT